MLDICTGLAYTAIAASKTGYVTTIELDPTMTQICQMNPHSRMLFQGRIRQLYGNAADVVKTLANKSFDVIIHDPPTFALAGELYSTEFYTDLSRLLKKKGKLYHYVGDPKSKSKGGVVKGVVQRLRQAGFGGVAIDNEAYGVIASRDHIRVNKPKRAQKDGRTGTQSSGRRSRNVFRPYVSVLSEYNYDYDLTRGRKTTMITKMIPQNLF